jgi:thioredoxin 1
MITKMILLLLPIVVDAYWLQMVPHASARRTHVRACAADDASSMRIKDIKAELDERGVQWRGVCFDKESLLRVLEEARVAPAPPPPQNAAQNTDKDMPEESGQAADAADEAAVYEAAYASALADALKLKTKELRSELASRSVGWADLNEKEELAKRLAELVAKSALFSRSGALTPGQASVVTAEQLRIEMQDDRSPLLIDVFATWCGPCKLIAPMLSSLADKLGSEVRVAKLDSDAHADLSTELRVAGLPTLIFMRDGKEVHRLEGVPGNAAALEQLAMQHLGVAP